MNPYLKALRQKKFEGMKIDPSPVDREYMEQAAAGGDGAPEVTDSEAMSQAPQMAALGQMETEIAVDPNLYPSEELPITDTEAMTFVDNAEATPNIMELTSEEVFGASAPEGKPNGLRERAMQNLKRKK